MQTTAFEQNNIVTPSPSEIVAAREAIEQLGNNPLFVDASMYQLIVNGYENMALNLPASVMGLVRQLLSEMADGHAVTITSIHEELSTQKAADLLNVSRPYLIQLLEGGEIPFHKVGTHRRVRLADVLAYKRQVDSSRVQVLEELAEQAQRLGMGY